MLQILGYPSLAFHGRFLIGCANHQMSEGLGFFSADDVVYMANDAEKEEYVLNDTGTIYVGSAYSIYDRPWNFGQVKHTCLVSPITLLHPFSMEPMSSSKCWNDPASFTGRPHLPRVTCVPTCVPHPQLENRV